MSTVQERLQAWASFSLTLYQSETVVTVRNVRAYIRKGYLRSMVQLLDSGEQVMTDDMSSQYREITYVRETGEVLSSLV